MSKQKPAVPKIIHQFEKNPKHFWPKLKNPKHNHQIKKKPKVNAVKTHVTLKNGPKNPKRSDFESDCLKI